MPLILCLLLLFAGAELSLWQSAVWQVRRSLSCSLTVLDLCFPATLLIVNPAIWTGLVFFFGLYRAANMLRIYKNRVHPDYLYHTSRRTSLVLIIIQTSVVAFAWLSHLFGIKGTTWETVVAILQLVSAAGLVFSFRRQLDKTLPTSAASLATKELPSLTVAIPARNETADLESCLQSLLTSSYAKLEIIVLDDCSQNKRTPEIIRGFAHDGVRFIAGDVPPDHWLAKNYAYKRLSEEANGELLLFCGVDVRFKPDSLKLLVSTMLTKHKAMVSIVPRNELSEHHYLISSLVQSGRYAWEFLLPRRLLGRPAVLSTCWLIKRQALQTVGGFDAYAQSIIAERHIAAKIVHLADGYSFVRATSAMGIDSRKDFSEQCATAIRTRYPQLHKRPESVALYSASASLIFIMPYKLLAAAAISQLWSVVLISGLSCALLTYVGFNLLMLTYRRRLWRGLVLLPFIVAYDIGVLNYSMIAYEFSEVLWKGRNICVPVMRVIPRFPPLEN